jgi:hypothetical protein
MVHALEEIRRTLKPDGIMIDLRPVAERWNVELVSGQGQHLIGRLTDLPAGLADDEAANSAIQEASLRGWFLLEREQSFPFFYYWDTPQEMMEYVQEKLVDYIQIEQPVYFALKEAWTRADANRQIRVRVKMHLARWRKC